jgi:CRISPR-associated protein Cas5h
MRRVKNIKMSRNYIVFDVSSDWGHFRKVSGNVVKRSYYVPPRTTMTGMIAAILGLDRDSYYDTFGMEKSRIAIGLNSKVRTKNVSYKTLDTSGLLSVNSRGGGPKLSTPNPEKGRQRHTYEVLVNPSYRVYFSSKDKQDMLKDYLEEGKSYYTPSMGLSEFLASVNYIGEFEEEELGEGEHMISTAVPAENNDVLFDKGKRISSEKSPGQMGIYKGERRCEAFLTLNYSPDGEPLRVRTSDAKVINGTKVIPY